MSTGPAASRGYESTSPESISKDHVRATAEKSTGVVTMLLMPFMALAFALLHFLYQLVVAYREFEAGFKDALRRRMDRRAPASIASLRDLLSIYQGTRASVHLPKHMAVVLAGSTPSSRRLYLSTLLMRIRHPDTPATQLWADFKAKYETAVEAKHVNDLAALIHLARVTGVQQLSVYTEQPLSAQALQALNVLLQSEYKTKVEYPAEEANAISADEPNSWSKYAELRRRTRSTAKSDSSSPSSPGSPGSSSDSEAGLSSLDETLASSYTAENEQASHAVAKVFVGTGTGSIPSNPASRDDTVPESINVMLLSQEDGQERFTDLISAQIHKQARAYFSNVLMPDIAAATSAVPRRRFSASTLRKAWVTKRQTFTSQLTVAELDDALAKAGYLGEPELLIVFGGKANIRRLYGFPAWPIRLTDLFFDPFMQAKNAYGCADFVAALRKLAKNEQRYGK